MATKHAHARSTARRTALSSPAPHVCSLCQYPIGVDVAHIRPLASFKEGTPTSVINHPSNLTYFCKRCHYEFDSGLLNVVPPSLEDLSKVMHAPVIAKPGPALHNTPKPTHSKIRSLIRL